MREVCFILAGERVLGVYAGSETAIPDSRARWNAIWRHRGRITEITHTHPGNLLLFSAEDLATMDAVEAGTGRTFTWSIVTSNGYLSRTGARGTPDILREDRPAWLGLLRAMSFNGLATQAMFVPNKRTRRKGRGSRIRKHRLRRLRRVRASGAKRQLLKRRGR